MEKHFAELLAKGDADIKTLREKVAFLEAENISLKTEGLKKLEREKEILVDKIRHLEETIGQGESEVILKMKTEVEMHKTTIARLMLKVDELNLKLKAN